MANSHFEAIIIEDGTFSPPPPPTLTNLYGDTSLNYCIFIELNSAPYRNTHYPMEYEFMALSVCKVLNIMHTYSAGK